MRNFGEEIKWDWESNLSDRWLLTSYLTNDLQNIKYYIFKTVIIQPYFKFNSVALIASRLCGIPRKNALKRIKNETKRGRVLRKNYSRICESRIGLFNHSKHCTQFKSPRISGTLNINSPPIR